MFFRWVGSPQGPGVNFFSKFFQMGGGILRVLESMIFKIILQCQSAFKSV
jgi:hypothetical protein